MTATSTVAKSSKKPEAPVVDDREVRVRPVERGRQVEDRDRHRRVEEEGGELSLHAGFHGRPQSPEHEEQPEHQAHGQQQLPEATQIEVLAALVAEPEPEAAELVVDPRHFPEEAAEDHHGQGAQEDKHAGPLALGLSPPHQRGKEEAAGHPGRGDPEDGQLQMPGARQIVGQVPGQVEAVEAAGLHPVMGQHAAQGRLPQEEQGDHCKVQGQGLLAGREGPLLEGAREAGCFPFAPGPAQVVELPKDEEDQTQAAQQRHQTEATPEEGRAGGRVAHQGLIGPVVGVGITSARPQGHGRPGGPGEVGVQRLELLVVLNEAGWKARGSLGP